MTLKTLQVKLNNNLNITGKIKKQLHAYQRLTKHI